jgi:DNA repair protein RadC
MSDLTLHSDSTPAKSVRRGRSRRSAPREAGTDLLQFSSRVTAEEARVLAQARAILLRLVGRTGASLTAPRAVREYLITLLASQEREFFAMVALDTRHRVIATEILFVGTIDRSGVHPREVVRCALRHNAAAVILAHYVAGHVMRITFPRSFCALGLQGADRAILFAAARHITEVVADPIHSLS